MTEKVNVIPNKRDNIKKNFLELYEKRACNVSAVCRELQIGRDFYYDHIKTDPDFAKACSHIEEGLIDFAENQLIKNIKEGKETSLIFFLKCKAKHRGYVERQEFEHSGDIKIEVEWDNGTSKDNAK
jgi:hypothetical protein